ncbi:MAG: MFS transporter, partial [Deltaproteobacteria bacterium]|nr:MFS transporter [Deltaproteobacteria bacterium]
MDAVELTAEAVPARRPKMFYGWYIVAVSFLCWFAADSFGWYTFGIFIKPITEELGWTTVMLTGALTLRSIFSGLIDPIIGPLADTRHGARILMSAGVLIAGSVPLAVSRVSEPWQFYLFYGIIGALGMVGFGGLVTNAIISKWFIRLRGRAIGVSTMGVSIAGLIFVPMVHSLNARLGWRTTLVVLALIIWVLTIVPVVLLVRRRPEDMGLLPDGDEPEETAAEDGDLANGGPVFAGEEIWTLK